MKKGLKNKIKTAFESETPDFRERIISACDNETQISSPIEVSKQKRSPVFFRRLVSVMTCLILFGAGMFVGNIIPENQPVATAETSVYLDVNPSLELSLDQDNAVLRCVALNEDGEIVLNNMKLDGVELKTALNAIIGSMYVKGYISATDNSMLISVDTNDEDNTSGFLSYITKQVNQVFAESEVECAIIAQGLEVDEDLKCRAKEQGVSVGKMHLLDKMISANENLTIEDIPKLSDMSIKDLNLLYTQRGEQTSKNELISGSVNIEVTTSDALDAVLTSMDKTISEVEFHHVHILPSERGESKIIYAITLKFKGEEIVYKYEVDCQSGEVSLAEEMPTNKDSEQHDNNLQPPHSENHEQAPGNTP